MLTMGPGFPGSSLFQEYRMQSLIPLEWNFIAVWSSTLESNRPFPTSRVNLRMLQKYGRVSETSISSPLIKSRIGRARWAMRLAS